MLEKHKDPRFKSVSRPSADAMATLRAIKQNNKAPIIAEVGIGVGVTTLAMAQQLNNEGQIYIFDYSIVVSEITKDLLQLGWTNIRPFGNSRARFDSYNWNIAKLFLENRGSASPLLFDFIYLDGAHTLTHDGLATAILKEMVHIGGYILMDDYNWSLRNSPTMNPTAMPEVAEWYTQEQIDTPHVKMICDIFLDTDQRFVRDDLGGKMTTHRALYRRVS